MISVGPHCETRMSGLPTGSMLPQGAPVSRRGTRRRWDLSLSAPVHSEIGSHPQRPRWPGPQRPVSTRHCSSARLHGVMPCREFANTPSFGP